MDGMGKVICIHWLQFAPIAWDGTLTEKNLLPLWEQILSCKSTITIPYWIEVVEIPLVMQVNTCFKLCLFKILLPVLNDIY